MGLREQRARKCGHRQMVSELWFAATAKDSLLPDTRKRELAIAQLNPHSASEVADMISGSSLQPKKLGKASLA